MTRKLGFAAFTLLSLLVAASAFSLPCQSETITFYGYLMSDGSVWCNPPLIGPYHGPTIVGQITYACDGHTYSWGNTSCSVHPPTYEYDDCGCEYGRLDGAENDDVREGAPADETARACAE